ncbi:beta-galactosidase trimerization domain-containing protein [Streptomyces sp. NPDC050428]|uniref:beta-galactosidase n=1 Tax=Streptomyces sp. NPDC050428 TaxID=3155757 RepID=UPI00341B0595
MCTTDTQRSAGAIYTADRTLPKEPGDALHHSLAHIARGSEGTLFFQWRQSRAGAELWHSAMVPHAGPDSRIFREVTEIGEVVSRLGELAGSRVRAQAAVLHDADCWWALDGPGRPSADLDYPGALRRAHRVLWDAGITADFAHPADPDLSRYRVVLAPALYLLSDTAADALRAYVHGGGILLVQHFGGVVDEHHHARLGGYPAAPLREALGVRVEEFRPLAPDQALRLSDGSTGTVWSESVRTGSGAASEPQREPGPTAEVVAAYTQGMLAGQPALTRHSYGAGTAWYLSTRLDDAAYNALLARITDEAGAPPELPGAPHSVEAVRRWTQDGTRCWLFLLNHGNAPVNLPASVLGRGHDLLTGQQIGGDGLVLSAGGAAVLRQAEPPGPAVQPRGGAANHPLDASHPVTGKGALWCRRRRPRLGSKSEAE